MLSCAHIQTYHWDELYRFQDEIEGCFDSLKQSIEFHENLIHDKLNELEAYTEQYCAKSEMDEETKSQYEYQIHDPAENAIKTMKYIQRNAILISSFTIFESKIKKLSQLLKRDFDKKEITRSSPGSSDIDKIRKYIIDEIGISTEILNSKLLEIENDKIIRNAIVHNDSIIEEKYMERFETPLHIILSDSREVFIESSLYLIALIEKMKNFISELFKEIDLKISKN